MNEFKKRMVFVYGWLNVKTVLFQTIPFCISTQFSSIKHIDRTLVGAINPGQSGPGSDGNEKVLYIPHSSRITGTSSSDCLVSYPGHSLWEGGLTPLTGQNIIAYEFLVLDRNM